ncbi:MAG: YqiA/YcfP family alpha/beta fold hydrolase [bacterium]|nr:YqiA/YcfP family alpha/beta fold hydrolase [bacterium]
MNVIYLHGFASSPQSKKAQWFKNRFADIGIDMRIPDLNVPSFEHLTMTDMLKTVHAEVAQCPPGDVLLIGSSLGGAVAINYADKHHYGALPEARRVTHLVLLAPAFDVIDGWHKRIGDEGMAAWKRDGWTEVFNYRINAPARLHHGFIDDMAHYNPYGAETDRPILIFHGLRDETVPSYQSERYAGTRVHVELRLVDSDHELLDQTDAIWAALRNIAAR